MGETRQALIGLVGGMSWEATALYYARLNRLVRRRLGGHHNARSVLVTLDFEDLVGCAEQGDWASVAREVRTAAETAEAAGAAFVMLTAMTAHAVADEVAAALKVPLLHAGEVLAGAAAARGITRLGLLGTGTTLTGAFLAERLRGRGILSIMPSEPERELLDRIILGELAHGEVRPASRQAIVKMAEGLVQVGAETVVLACTELPLLLPLDALEVPVLDLVGLHVETAVDWSLHGTACDTRPERRP